MQCHVKLVWNAVQYLIKVWKVKKKKGRQLNLWPLKPPAKTPFKTLRFYTRLTLKVFRKSTPKRLQLRALFLLPEGLWNVTSDHSISSPEFQGRTTFLQSMNKTDRLIFFRIVRSKNGQLKCPNTTLLVLLVAADEDCRLIFSIWWINRADQQCWSTWNWNLTNLERNYVVIWSFKTGKNFIFPTTEISVFRRWYQECFGKKPFFISKQSFKSLFVTSLPYHLTLIAKLVFDIIIP